MKSKVKQKIKKIFCFSAPRAEKRACAKKENFKPVRDAKVEHILPAHYYASL